MTPTRTTFRIPSSFERDPLVSRHPHPPPNSAQASPLSHRCPLRPPTNRRENGKWRQTRTTSGVPSSFRRNPLVSRHPCRRRTQPMPARRSTAAPLPSPKNCRENRKMTPNKDHIQDSVLISAKSPRFTTPVPPPNSAQASPQKRRCHPAPDDSSRKLEHDPEQGPDPGFSPRLRKNSLFHDPVPPPNSAQASPQKHRCPLRLRRTVAKTGE